MRDNFRFELAPYPLPLFDECGMRKNVKSELYNYFDPVPGPSNLINTIYVIDGGYLLHKVVWNKNNKCFLQVAEQYVNYIQNFRSKCVIVFDGYSYDLSTKNTERIRRLQRLRCPDIAITKVSKVTVTQDKFLSNSSNKESLIKLISELLIHEDIEHKICRDDADVEIIKMAISKKESDNEVIIIGEDTDLLIILTALAHDKEKIYLKKQQKKLKTFICITRNFHFCFQI